MNVSPSASQSATARHAVEVLIDSFVRQQNYVPAKARAVSHLEDLHPRLQDRARDLEPLSGWRAWSLGTRLWFITARLCSPERSPAGLLILQIRFFDKDGHLAAAGEWSLQAGGHWKLLRVIDSDEGSIH